MAFEDSAKTGRRPGRSKVTMLLLVIGLLLVAGLFYVVFLKTGDKTMLIVPGTLLLVLIVMPFFMRASGFSDAQTGAQVRFSDNLFELMRKGQVANRVKKKDVFAAIVCLQYPCLILCLDKDSLLRVEGEFARKEKIAYMSVGEGANLDGKPVHWRKLYQQFRESCSQFEKDGLPVAHINDIDGWLGTLNGFGWKKRVRKVEGKVANEYLVVYERPVKKAT